MKDFEDKVSWLLQLGRVSFAEKLVSSELENRGKAAPASLLRLLGVICYKQSKFDQAIQMFRRSLEVDPDAVETRLHLAVAYCDLGQYAEASEVYGRAQALATTHSTSDMERGVAQAFVDLARKLLEKGETAEAERYFKRAIQRENRTEWLHELAELYLATDQPKKAREVVQDARKSDPQHPHHDVILGMTDFVAGSQHQARAHWERAAQGAPGDRVAAALGKLSENWPADSDSPNTPIS